MVTACNNFGSAPTGINFYIRHWIYTAKKYSSPFYKHTGNGIILLMRFCMEVIKGREKEIGCSNQLEYESPTFYLQYPSNRIHPRGSNLSERFEFDGCPTTL